MNHENDIPKFGDHGVFEVKNDSWLKKDQNYQGHEKLGYNLNDEELPKTDEEKNVSMGKERELRDKLRVIDAYEKTPDVIAALIKASDLTEDLLKWAHIHKINRAVIMKSGEGDILIVPQTQLLLEAAEILKQKK